MKSILRFVVMIVLLSAISGYFMTHSDSKEPEKDGKAGVQVSAQVWHTPGGKNLETTVLIPGPGVCAPRMEGAGTKVRSFGESVTVLVSGAGCPETVRYVHDGT